MLRTMTPDVNVLAAASRADHPQHTPALAWLRAAIKACGNGARLEILPIVASGYLRVVTHPKVFAQPTPIDAAAAFLDAILATPGVVIPPVGCEWRDLRRLCLDGGLIGNLIPDAWIAAAVRSLDSHLVTFDRGFGKLLSNRELTLLPIAARTTGTRGRPSLATRTARAMRRQ